APALRASRTSLGETLKEGGRSLVGGSQRLKNLLVIAEIALSLVLLIGAGLLIRSFVRAQRVDPGFAPQNVISLRLSTLGTSYQEQTRRLAFFQELWERIRRMPGVESAGGVSILPLAGGIGWGSITIEGYNPVFGQDAIQADSRTASVGYFETMNVPLLRGRFFTEQDTKDSMQVAIVDEKMVRAYWPNTDPIGKRLKFGGENSKAPWMTVVGVVANVKQYALDTDSRVALYMPHLQSPDDTMYAVARTKG